MSAVVGRRHVLRHVRVGLRHRALPRAVPRLGALVSGEIGEDFAYYLAKSEQIPSAVMLGVLVRARESGETFVAAAGGLMIQVMPGADERVVAAIESTVSRTPHTTAAHPRGRTPRGLAARGARRRVVRGARRASGGLRLHLLIRARGVSRLVDRRGGAGVDAARRPRRGAHLPLLQRDLPTSTSPRSRRWSSGAGTRAGETAMS